MNLRLLALVVVLTVLELHAQTTSFRYFYDDANELFRVLDSTGTMIEYVYDPAGNITQINRTTIGPGTPSIFNVTPLSGSWGDTVTILGQNFSAIAANDVVTINGVRLTVLSATATQMVFLVPPNLTTGQIVVTVNGTVVNSGPTLVFTPLPSQLNYAVAPIFSVENGTVPGTVPPTGQNETPFRIFSVLNGTALPTGNEVTANIFSVQNGSIPGSMLSTGANEAPFWIFSVLNGAVPGSAPATGANESPFWIFSGLNGSVPGSAIPTGSNESVFPLFSVGNSTSNATSFSRLPVSTSGPAAAAGKPRILMPAGRAAAGQTIQIAAAVDNPTPGATVEFFINGESFGTYAPPYGFPLTVPYTTTSLRVTGVAQGVASQETAIGIEPESSLRLRGRIATEDGAPVGDKAVSLVYSGLRAELFHFPTQLREMPNLEGMKPVAERAVASLNLRNPGGIFGKDPLGTGLGPDYAIRFTASLNAERAGDYVFSLRGREGVSLRIGGSIVTDGAKVHLDAGPVSLEALVYVGSGAMEIQLLWQPPGQLLQAVPDGVLWSKLPALRAVTDLSGQFEFMAVPSSLGLVKVTADGVESGPIPAASGDVGALIVRKAVQ